MANNEHKIVIFVGAHPDDIELSCSGTIIKFLQNGFKVICIFVTKGGKGNVTGDGPEVRVKESIDACKILGVKKENIFFGDFEDTAVPNSVETIHYLEKFYSQDVYAVFIPSDKETHQDHRAVSNACITAFRYVPRVLAYESPSTTAAFAPTSFVDMSSFLRLKRRALKCHISQISQNRMYMEYKAMMCISAFRGRQIGRRYAEAFETIKCLIEPL